jgi:RNA-directed DNA polymerase
MAKGRAGSHRGQSTDARGRNAPTQSISSTLTALNRKAVKDRKHRFRSLYRLIDKQMLYDCFHQLKRGAAPGVDGVTVSEYEKRLAERLESLLSRLIGKRYRAQPVRRRYIPKTNGKLRPLGIPALEDKIVQLAASRILGSIYEADFSERSVGYRKGKPGARQSSYQLGRELNDGTYRWIVEADIRSFFDEVDHDWLIQMIEQRVKDSAFTGLIRKWLKAGVLEPDETVPWSPEKGTPQGGIISPVLANIYLHYVLDLWIEKKLSREYRGKVIFMRYADDIIVGFEWKRNAEDYLRRLPDRLAKFSLRLAEEKSSLVKFNRWEPDDSGRFTFLGFDFYWSRMRKNRNHKIVKRKTNKKKYRGALRAMKDWIRRSRSWPLKMILSSLRRRLRGYWNYCCVKGNSRMTWKYYREVSKLMFKWLNRRSQRKSYTWGQFGKLWGAAWQVPRPRVAEVQPDCDQDKLALVCGGASC